MRPRPLPSHLGSRPFRTRDVDLTARRVRASDLNRSVWGVRVASSELDLRTACKMFALRLSGDVFFSHSTAALLLGAPLPLSIEKSPLVHISVAAPASPPHANGIVGHRLSIERRDVVMTRGIRHTSAARTWCDLATVLQLDDLVAAGDYLIHHETPLTSRDEIARVLATMSGMRGVRRAREALALLSDRPESPQESKLRLIVLRAGLPEPEINHVIINTETGKDMRPDFRLRKYKLILEYQGDYHRTKSQWRKDMTRRSRGGTSWS